MARKYRKTTYGEKKTKAQDRHLRRCAVRRVANKTRRDKIRNYKKISEVIGSESV